MTHYTQHTVYLQDGTLCNFRKRLWRHTKPLLSCFEMVTDPRKKRGIRYSHVFLIFLVFAAVSSGCTTLTDCHIWAIHNRKFLLRLFPYLYGIPDPTTISYLFQKLVPSEIVAAYMQFIAILGVDIGDVISVDGKTIRAVTGEDSIRHILSLFTHVGHTTVGQIGVSQKENEIPALKRLIQDNPEAIAGKLLLADALHTNPATAKTITDATGDYLLVVKGNQKDLFADIIFSLSEQNLHIVSGVKFPAVSESYTFYQTKRKRFITTTVKTSNDVQIIDYTQSAHGWEEVKTIGMLKRTGTRTSKDGTIIPIDETIGIISSKKLSASEMANLLRNHWCIENNLHWVKDFVFLEDRQPLRTGNAPQIMSFLRSMCISLLSLLQFKSIATAIQNFEKSKTLHYQFLKLAAVI